MSTTRLALLALLLSWSPLAGAQDVSLPPLVFEEEDGSPSVVPTTVKVTNTTLTDNADGSISISTGGGGDSITVNATAATNANFLDNLYIDWAIDTAATPDDITAKFNYPALTGDHATLANEVIFGQNGLIAEGATADTIELYFSIPDPATSDKTITFQNATHTLVGRDTTDTLTNKTIAAADNVVTADDTICTDCLNATEIEDIYLLNSGDVGTGVYDFGGADSFEVPNGAAPTVDAFGELAGDNDLWAASRGAPVFYDGTAATALVNVLVSDAPSNGQVPKWNTGGTITWEADADSGGATAWDAIGNPAGTGDVAMAETVQTLSWDSAATAAAYDALTVQITHDSTTDSSTQRGLVVERLATTGTAAWETLVQIQNNDTDGAVTTGLEILSAAGAITTAIDVSDAEIGTALAIGGNAITSAAGATADFGDAESVEVPNGTAPTVNADGEIAHDTTADQLILGADADVFDPRRSAPFTLESPADADNFLLGKLQYGITITDVHCIVDPADTGESVVIDIQERDSAGDTPVSFDAAITCDNDGAEDDGTLTNPTFDAGDWVSLDIGTVTGTVTQVSGTIYFQVVRE